MTIKLLIAVTLLGTGSILYFFYMNKMPVAIKLYRYTDVKTHTEIYPFSEISGVSGKTLKLKNGTASNYVSYFRFINRKGDEIPLGAFEAAPRDLNLITPYLID